MHRVLFVCHGNICRSTMAEYVMRHLVRERGIEAEFQIDSAAATRDAVGMGVHRGTREVLKRHGVACGNHRARTMTRADYDRYDLIIGMDQENLYDMRRILRTDPQHKIHLLLDWTNAPRDVADPWYTGDFDTTFADVMTGCVALLDKWPKGPRAGDRAPKKWPKGA